MLQFEYKKFVCYNLNIDTEAIVAATIIDNRLCLIYFTVFSNIFATWTAFRKFSIPNINLFSKFVNKFRNYVTIWSVSTADLSITGRPCPPPRSRGQPLPGLEAPRDLGALGAMGAARGARGHLIPLNFENVQNLWISLKKLIFLCNNFDSFFLTHLLLLAPFWEKMPPVNIFCERPMLEAQPLPRVEALGDLVALVAPMPNRVTL